MANIRTGRKSGFILRGGVLRRETRWLDVPRTDTTVAASATAVITNTMSADELSVRPFTLLRAVGSWLVRSDQSAATEIFQGNVGACVVSDQAVAIGVTAVPTPATDLASDLWFFHRMWPGSVDLIGTSWSATHDPQPYESKAMRKVEDGQDIVYVVEAGIGDQGCIISHAGRLLIKLH